MSKKKTRKKAKNAPKKTAKKKKAITRGKSKILLVRDPDAPKDQPPEAFRPDAALKKFLNEELPKGTKSDFILEAIWEKISKTKEVTCPMCKGHGKIGPNVEVVKS